MTHSKVSSSLNSLVYRGTPKVNSISEGSVPLKKINTFSYSILNTPFLIFSPVYS